MSNATDRIQYEGFINKEPPEVTLEKLFDYEDHLHRKDVAFVWVDVKIRGSETQRAGSYQYVNRHLLKNYKISRISRSSIHSWGIRISLDYSLDNWPNHLKEDSPKLF